METAALRQAFEVQDSVHTACWIRAALQIRRDRFQEMDSVHIAYERGIELGEGLAFYVEKKALRSDKPDIPQTGFPADRVRLRGYTSGVSLALLLQQFAPDWEASFEKDDQQFLDIALEQHISSHTLSTCDFQAAEVDQATVEAESDVAALLSQRKQLRLDFEAKPGWQLIIESAETKPLWPQRFDPKNLQLVDGGVLHTRFLKLGNAAGELELLGSQAFTESAGSHPLFNGIQRFVMTGIAEKPKVKKQGEGLSIEFPTFSAAFSQARITESRQKVHIKLLP
ncbi:hypothetical protein MJD09_22280 [bacterium]|nr:hypothetical protein [bacterium]